MQRNRCTSMHDVSNEREKQKQKTWTLMSKINICSENHFGKSEFIKGTSMFTKIDMIRVKAMLVSVESRRDDYCHIAPSFKEDCIVIYCFSPCS